MLCALALLIVIAPEQRARFSFTEIAMGCDVRIELFASCEHEAVQAARLAFDRVRALDETLSDYLQSSEVNRIPSEAGSSTVISADLAAAISESLRVTRATDGAFDLSAGALSQLWRDARRQKLLPTDEAIAAARARCGFAALTLQQDPPRLTCAIADLRLDFGAIGKGFAAQAAVDSLKSRGVNSALCAVAGDIACGDPPPGTLGWSIEIASELGDSATHRVLLCNQSISTSGDASQHLEIGAERHSHIFDPRTGRAVTRRIAATVVSRSGAVADALATALCVEGEALLNQQARLVDALGGFEAYVIELRADANGAPTAARITATKGWHSLQESPPAPAATVQTATKAASDSSDSPARHPK